MMHPDTAPMLLGDIGGTHSRFAMIDRIPEPDERPQLLAFHKSSNDDYRSFDDALSDYLERQDFKPGCAVFAVAGPVSDNAVRLTNRAWEIDGGVLSRKFAIPDILLINDFAAMARSAPLLRDEEQVEICAGDSQAGHPLLVAGAGTGFGMATLVPRGDNWITISGEGGHMAYSPQTELEYAVHQRLMAQYGFVSVERVSSGKHLDNLMGAVADIHGLQTPDLSPAQVRSYALEGDALCNNVLQIQSNAIMTALGDGVLVSGAIGGVHAAGGVTQHLIPWLKSPEAMARFFERGPRRDYMTNIPISVITSPEAPLVGAAHFLTTMRMEDNDA